MKAIIVAAGKGNRLYPLTRDVPKPLLKINEDTILQHQLQNLNKCGINNVIIVTGYLANKIQEASGLNIKYIYNPDYEITNSLVSLWYARGELNDDIVYLHADVVFAPSILGELLSVREDICLVVEKKRCVAEDMKVMVRGNLITEINKTMNLSKSYGEFIGIAWFSKKGAAVLANILDMIVKEEDLMLWFESAIQRLVDEGHSVYKCDTQGKPWIEIDFLGDLETARARIYPSIKASLT